jgi:hypothetical protein
MARGDPAMPFEQLLPYYRGARFALVAMKLRHSEDADLVADADQYIGMLQRYEQAVIATWRLRRQEAR